MDILLILAQADAATAAGGWDAKVLGPLGALVITLMVLAVYARQTEKVRLPKMATLLSNEQAEHKQTRKDCDEAKAKIRIAYEAREKALRKRLTKWQSRHSRERTRRVFFQTEAGNLAKRLDEQPPELPTEIGATSYQHRPLPPDPDPDDFSDDEELPPPPEL